MPNEPDVIPGVPSTPPTPEEPTVPVPEPVSPAQPVEPDRPLQNVTAEFNRKIGKVESRLDELIALIAQQSVKPTAPAHPLAQYSDEQLAELYRAGSAEAGIALQERIASRHVQAQSTADKRAQRVQQEMLVLVNKYPALRDPQSPLREAAMNARSVLINQGAQPGPETDLEAVKYAILDNPQVPQPTPAPAPATPAPAQIDGVKPRRVTPPNAPPPKLNPKAIEIAKRMGVKDPEKSLERFYKRQEAGRSAVSPLIQTIVREE